MPDSIQEQFLKTISAANIPVTIFLASGVKLQGIIPQYDPYCILLQRGDQRQLVYKHSIATIVPGGDV